MTVGDIICEIDFCTNTMHDLEKYADMDDTIDSVADTMRKAVDIIEKYIDELECKQIK